MAQTRLNSFDDASSESKGWDPKANLKRQRSPDLNLSDDDAPVVKRTRQNTPSQHEHADLPVASVSYALSLSGRVLTGYRL